MADELAYGPWCYGEAVPHGTRQQGCTSVRVVGRMYSMLSAGLADASTAMKSLAQLASGLSAGLAYASMGRDPWC